MTLPSEAEFNEWLDATFAPAKLGQEHEYYSEAIDAFQNLTVYFLQKRLKGRALTNAMENIRFDFVGITCMLKRYQRDAFGVKRFAQLMDQIEGDGKVDASTKDVILKEVHKLGLRVTSESPRKTREAAVFSLWMSTFRPVTFDSTKLHALSPESQELFCAMLNFWIARSYLEKVGDVILGQTESEIEIRSSRIRHDFTCRDLNLSSLEMLYGGIFRLFPHFVEHENTTVKTSSFKK